MRVLLDENLPHDLAAALVGFEVVTVQGMGWAGIKNGDLLHRASGQIEAFVTMDRNLRHQQNLGALPYGVSSSSPAQTGCRISLHLPRRSPQPFSALNQGN